MSLRRSGVVAQEISRESEQSKCFERRCIEAKACAATGVINKEKTRGEARVGNLRLFIIQGKSKFGP